MELNQQKMQLAVQAADGLLRQGNAYGEQAQGTDAAAGEVGPQTPGAQGWDSAEEGDEARIPFPSITLLLLWFLTAMRLVGSWFADQGSNPCSLAMEELSPKH